MKGQILSQVVVFVLAGFIFLLVLFFGYKGIISLMEKEQKVSIVELQSSAEAVFNRVSQKYGDVEKYEMRMPSTFSEVCFVTSKDIETEIQGERARIEPLEQYRALMYSSWQTGAANAFLEPSGPTFLIEKVQVAGTWQGNNVGFCCYKGKGKIAWRLEGRGKYVIVKPWDGECNS